MLRYYIILTSKEDMHSTEYLEERFGSFKTLPPPKRSRMSISEAVPPAAASSCAASSLDVNEAVREASVVGNKFCINK